MLSRCSYIYQEQEQNVEQTTQKPKPDHEEMEYKLQPLSAELDNPIVEATRNSKGFLDI